MLEVNVIGYGQMGRQIASLLNLLGCEVVLWSRTKPEETSILRQIKILSKVLEIPINSKSIRIVSSIKELSKRAITIEAVAENIEVKREIFNYCNSNLMGAYYTNSSSYSPAEIGNKVGGLHFFNPISLKLIEFFQPVSIRNNEIDFLLKILEQRDFKVIYAQSNRGYLANSLLFREVSNVFFMIEQKGYTVSEIEKVYSVLNKDRFIFDIVDLVGVDITYSILENLKVQDSSIYLPAYLRYGIEKNILGKKNKTSIKKFINEIIEDLSN